MSKPTQAQIEAQRIKAMSRLSKTRVRHIKVMEDDVMSEMRAALSEITSYLEELLEDQKFPGIGRSDDEKQQNLVWWEDRQAAVRRALKILDGDWESI